MRQKTPAIILPANTSGFSILNSLRLGRIPAIALGYSKHRHEMRSAYPEKIFLDPEADPDPEILEALLKLRARGGVIFSAKDSQVLFLSRHRRELEGFGMCIPSDDIVETLIDKARETETMTRLGFRLPETVSFLPQDPRDLNAVLGDSIILKPRVSKLQFPRKNFLARTPAELDEIYGILGEKISDAVAQRNIPGGPSSLWTCTCVFNLDHELVSAFTYRKMRTKPVRNGITTVAVSEWNEEVVERARAFGRRLAYTGPVDLEFKCDAVTGEYYYIEANPRYTLACEFATRCGVNQVLDGYRVALGENVKPHVEMPRQGVYYVNSAVDIRARRKAGEPFVRILWDLLVLFPRRRVGSLRFSLEDPWPFTRWSLGFVSRAVLFIPRRLKRLVVSGKPQSGPPPMRTQ